MPRAHDPYEDPEVRRRHRRLVRRAVWQVCNWTALILGVLGSLLALVIAATEASGVGEFFGGFFFVWIVLLAPALVIGIPIVVVGWALAGPRVRRSGKAFGPHYCKQCGYALAGLTEPKCPECGRALALRSRSESSIE